MEIREKAKIRITHWLHHNAEHAEEYRVFSDELEASGMVESARHLRDTADLIVRSVESLCSALDGLEA